MSFKNSFGPKTYLTDRLSIKGLGLRLGVLMKNLWPEKYLAENSLDRNFGLKSKIDFCLQKLSKICIFTQKLRFQEFQLKKT